MREVTVDDPKHEWAKQHVIEVEEQVKALESAHAVLEQVVGNVQAGLAELVRKLKDGGVLK